MMREKLRHQEAACQFAVSSNARIVSWEQIDLMGGRGDRIANTAAANCAKDESFMGVLLRGGQPAQSPSAASDRALLRASCWA